MFAFLDHAVGHVTSHRTRKFLFLMAIAFFALLTTARAQVAIDAIVPADQGPKKTSVATGAFSTSSGNELLLAFISADNTSRTNVTVNSVSGAGLTWVRVIRTNVQRGTAEIWRAFAPSALTNVTVTAALSQSVSSSMTVMSFSKELGANRPSMPESVFREHSVS